MYTYMKAIHVEKKYTKSKCNDPPPLVFHPQWSKIQRKVKERVITPEKLKKLTRRYLQREIQKVETWTGVGEKEEWYPSVACGSKQLCRCVRLWFPSRLASAWVSILWFWSVDSFTHNQGGQFNIMHSDDHCIMHANTHYQAHANTCTQMFTHSQTEMPSPVYSWLHVWASVLQLSHIFMSVLYKSFFVPETHSSSW